MRVTREPWILYKGKPYTDPSLQGASCADKEFL